MIEQGMLRAPVSPAALLALSVATALSGCRGGCSRVPSTGRPARGVLAWFPAETQIVVAVDFARLRATPLWTRLAALATSNPDDQAQIDEVVRRTGFDPLRQIDSVVVAFPEEARNGGAMGMVLHGKGFEEARLIAYARDQVAKQGDDLFSFRRSGQTLWATRKQPTVAGFFVDDRTFVFGAGGWAEKIAELVHADPPSGAETNLPLVHLVQRAGVTNPIWAAAIVPAATRALLASDPVLTSGAAVNRLALGIDVAGGLRAKLIADLASQVQAQAMTAEVGNAIRAAKKSPQVLLMGVGPYLDGVSARTVDVSSEIVVALSQAQVADGIERLRAFLALARQAGVPGFPHP
jgi:hypothetical protein